RRPRSLANARDDKLGYSSFARTERRWSESALWRRVAVDVERVSRVPRLRAGEGCDRGIQREMDERSVGAARRVVRERAVACTSHVSQLLSVRRALAVHGHSTGGQRMSAIGPFGGGGPARAIALPSSAETLHDVLAGLRSTPKTLPARLFY